MTAPGRYAASDGSFAKSAGSAAARGGILIAIAVVIGFALLAWGFDGGDTDVAVGPDTGAAAGGDADGGDTGGATTDTTDTTESTDTTDSTNTTDSANPTDSTDTGGTTDGTGTEEVVLDDPSTIRIAVLNGAQVAGLAGERAATLSALNYVTLPGNAADSPVTDSKVYFATGYGDEAKVVAEALGGSSSVLELAPDDQAALEDGTQAEAATANIIVMLGTDGAL